MNSEFIFQIPQVEEQVPEMLSPEIKEAQPRNKYCFYFHRISYNGSGMKYLTRENQVFLVQSIPIL